MCYYYIPQQQVSAWDPPVHQPSPPASCVPPLLWQFPGLLVHEPAE